PKAVVCDNLKAGVTKPSRYETGINRTYRELATHYGFAVLPTRIKKPRDKAKAEVAVQIVQRFVLARLRNRRFFSLDELNVAIRQPLCPSPPRATPPQDAGARRAPDLGRLGPGTAHARPGARPSGSP